MTTSKTRHTISTHTLIESGSPEKTQT